MVDVIGEFPMRLEMQLEERGGDSSSSLLSLVSKGARILVDTTDDDVPFVAPPVPPPPSNQPGAATATTELLDEVDTPDEDRHLHRQAVKFLLLSHPVVGPTVPLPTKVAPIVALVATPVRNTNTNSNRRRRGHCCHRWCRTPDFEFLHARSYGRVTWWSPEVPLNNIKGIVNNNNLPFLAGFNGNDPNNPNSNTVLQNTGNNNVVNRGNNLLFVAAGQLPAGITLRQLMFGSITVIGNELTEGHELGTGVIGQGQGFYLASSLDGSSHTFALTALFHGSDHEVDDMISFFGVHRTASEVSHIAVIGGTGKYEEAKGYATIESLPQVDEHTTDGVETIVHVNVYLTPV